MIDSFFNLLTQNKIRIEKSIIFPDHYNYKISDIIKIIKFAKERNLKIVTTEKDYIKINKFKINNIIKTIVDLKIDNPKKFKDFLIKYL